MTGYRKERLSIREVQILELVALGKSNLTVANQMGISIFTVKSMLNRMFSFCNVRNRAALVTYGFSHGLLDPNEMRDRWEEQGDCLSSVNAI